MQSIRRKKPPAVLIIPDKTKYKPCTGKVMTVGNDEMFQEVVKEGDQIVFAKFGGEEINLDRNDYIILQRNDILAVIR